MRWGMELQRKLRTILQVLDKCAAYPHLDSLKNIQLENVSLHHIPGTDNGHGYHTKFADLISCKAANYILKAIQENLLTPPSTA
jgi:hypothetical protein